MSESEQWRPWPRDPSISVSNLGRIKGPSGKLLAVRDGKINTKRATKNTRVKHVVWQTWVQPDAHPIPAITHADGDVTNCSATNLVLWDKRSGLPNVRKLSRQQEIDIASRLDSGETLQALAAEFDVSATTVSNTYTRVCGVKLTHTRMENNAAEMARKDAQSKALRVRRAAKKAQWEEDCAVAARLGIAPGSVRHKVSYLKREYGLTLAEYAAMIDSQSGKCAACGDLLGPERTHENQTLIGGTYRAVDHCHRTNDRGQSVRGVLHSSCNAIIGMIREDAEKMRRLIKYVQETREHRPKRPRPVTPGLPGLHH